MCLSLDCNKLAMVHSKHGNGFISNLRKKRKQHGALQHIWAFLLKCCHFVGVALVEEQGNSEGRNTVKAIETAAKVIVSTVIKHKVNELPPICPDLMHKMKARVLPKPLRNRMQKSNNPRYQQAFNFTIHNDVF